MIIVQILAAVIWGALWFTFGYMVSSYVGGRRK